MYGTNVSISHPIISPHLLLNTTKSSTYNLYLFGLLITDMILSFLSLNVSYNSFSLLLRSYTIKYVSSITSSYYSGTIYISSAFSYMSGNTPGYGY